MYYARTVRYLLFFMYIKSKKLFNCIVAVNNKPKKKKLKCASKLQHNVLIVKSIVIIATNCKTGQILLNGDIRILNFI